MTYEQKLITAVVKRLADGNQYTAADLMCVRQATISRWLSGNRAVSPPAMRLAEAMLVVAGKHGRVVRASSVKEVNGWRAA